VAEIELGRGRTTLPAGLQVEDGDQRCVVRLDDSGFHVEALESLSMPSWKASYAWESIQFLEVEATEAGAAIIIGDETPGKQRVELQGAALAEIEEALGRYRSAT
jgi:hypothetical protein